MPLAELGMALSGFKAAREMLTAVANGKMEIATMDRVLEAIRKLAEAQDTLYELREELLSKQEEVAELRSQIDARRQWEQDAARYHLKATDGGATVWASDDPLPHYACPACYTKQRISILQDRRTYEGSYVCPDADCKASYLIKKPVPTPTPVRTVISTGLSGNRPRDW